MIIDKDNSLVKNAINLGAMTGIALAILQLLFFFIGLGDSSGFRWLLYLLLLFSILYGLRQFRDHVNGGYLNYSQGLGFGVLLSVGTALIMSFFYYIYLNYIESDYLSKMLEQLEVTMYENEMDEGQIEILMKFYRSFLGPGMFAFSVLFFYTLLGFVFSLVLSFFVKNPKPIFED